MKRALSSAMAGLLSIVLLGACSGEGEEPAPEATATIDPGPGRFSPEEQEVVDAVLSYYEAFFSRGSAGIESAVEGKVTDQLADGLVPAEKEAVDDAGLEYIGDVRIDARQVTIDGESATFTGCQDGSDAFVVPAGDDTAGPGSRAVGTFDLTIELVRGDGGWLIDQPAGDRVDAC